MMKIRGAVSNSFEVQWKILLVVALTSFLILINLPRRYWKSPSRHFVRFLAAAMLCSCMSTSMISANEIDLPALSLLRSIPLPSVSANFGQLQSGNSHLTISRDGERLAAYVRFGLAIMIWSPNGAFTKEIPRNNDDGGDSHVLEFLSGHRIIISSPAADSMSEIDREKIRNVAFSVLDGESGQVIRQVPGPHPDERLARRNVATKIAVSPSEDIVAVLFRGGASRAVGIYSTVNWQQIASIELDMEQRWLAPTDLAFSPDGKFLAVVHGTKGRIKIFEVGSWALGRSFETFPEVPPPKSVIVASSIRVKPGSEFIAVGSLGGGSWWKGPDGMPAPNGGGVLVDEVPADPLRIYRVADGKLSASIGGFPGGFLTSSNVVWLQDGKYLAFLDAVGDLRLWNPSQPVNSSVVEHFGRGAGGLLTSPDQRLLFVSMPDSVKVFNIAN